MMFLDENEWGVVIIWTVEAFFEIMAWWSRNPVWGSVFTWASAAILNNQIDKLSDEDKEETDEGTFLAVMANTGVVVITHAASMAFLFAYLFFEQLQPWYEPLSFWNHGVFGLTDWSYMFTQIK